MMINIKKYIRRFLSDPSGVSAVEFAIVAPIMIVLFVGILEVSAGAAASRKTSRIASAVGDLITQSDNLTSADITNIMNISADIMKPYTNTVQIRVTGINITGGQAKVVWSCHKDWSKLGVGSNYNVPSAIKIDGTFLVAAQVNVNYMPMVGWAKYTGSQINFEKTAITMDEELFLRPRVSGIVNIAGC